MLPGDAMDPATMDVTIHPNPAVQYPVWKIPFLPERSLEFALHDMTRRNVPKRPLECRPGSHRVETAARPFGQYLARLLGGDSCTLRIMVWNP